MYILEIYKKEDINMQKKDKMMRAVSNIPILKRLTIPDRPWNRAV